MAKKVNNTAIKFLIFAFILFFLIVSGYEYIRYGSIFNNKEHFRKIYAEALEYKNNEDYSHCFSRLEDISPRYEAYDAVLYQQAQCAAKAGDEASSQKKLKSLISKYPQSHLYITSKYDLAKSYLRSNNKNEAIQEFQNIINNHPDTDFEAGSYYYLGEISKEKDINTAVKFWKKYIGHSQDGRFSMDCTSNLLNSKTELNKDDYLFIGLVFYNAQQYDDALKYLQQANESKSWFYIAKIQFERNNNAVAKDYIKNGLKKFSDIFPVSDLSDVLYLYANNSSNASEAWSELYDITKDNGKVADIVLYNKAKYEKNAEADKLYEQIVKNYIKGDYAADALKQLFWHAYKNNDYDLAKSYAIKHTGTFLNVKSSPEMHYWLGKVYEKLNDKNNAKKMYNKIFVKYPDDYYAMRAYGRLAFLEKGKDYGWHIHPDGEINQNKFELGLPYSYSEIKTKFGGTLAELLMVEDFTTIEFFYAFEEPFIESWIAYKKGLKSTATTTARNAMEKILDKPDRMDNKWKFVYPCYFIDDINKYALRNKISPYILISLIREESYFNPLALSSSHAVGLTQILPSTAREVSERKGYGNINEFLLFNPDINIKYGASYFAQINKQLDNNYIYAVAAYNGGSRAVSSWIRKNATDDMDEFIENIPYEETKIYVKKVFRSYWNYIRIYGE